MLSNGTFEHRDYLSAIMKFGIVREKFGDIVTYSEGADIIVQNENAEYFKNNLQELIRFKKSNIEILDISELHEVQTNYEEISIIVNSMRIDNFVSEIAHCSRNKAEEIILNERVMQNYEIISKNSKTVNINDILTIRGYGKFQVKKILRKTKNDKFVVILLHNC
jgi:RNA-binding protein YlmH